MPAELVLDARNGTGESPVWRADEQALYWVDIKGQFLHRLSLTDGSKKSWPMPERIGWVIERRDQPGFVAGTQGTPRRPADSVTTVRRAPLG